MLTFIPEDDIKVQENRLSRYQKMLTAPWYKWVMLLCGVLLVVFGVAGYKAQNPDLRAFCLLMAALSAIALLTSLIPVAGAPRIDRKLSESLEWYDLSKLRAFTKTFPTYRFVDIFRAVDRFAQTFDKHTVIESHHDPDLNTIINSNFYNAGQAAISIPNKVPRAVDYHEEIFYPIGQFWTVMGKYQDHNDFKAVLRVWVSSYTREVILELATPPEFAVEELTEFIVKDSIEHSIYRNKLLQISFDAGIKDEYGDIDAAGEVHLAFKQEHKVTEEDIVLDDNIKKVLERNVFDFHHKREQLRKYGVPSRKGVLFYGPPGTGKTYTCQYIYSTLQPVTTLVVTGQSLLQVKSICNLARMLQPSLLVLEDVDLIFTSREINLYSTALGDLMDELDGFQKDEAVTFLLTTNAIDRLEEAIKDRPGRINQCIYFGHPNAELRKRYIKRYLRPYNFEELELDEVVDLTKGSSQAFIKELIFRAVQVGLEDAERNGHDDKVPLHNADFSTAFDEMTKFNEEAAGSIMGFRVDR